MKLCRERGQFGSGSVMYGGGTTTYENPDGPYLPKSQRCQVPEYYPLAVANCGLF